MNLSHLPRGNPCSICGHSANKHRAYHKPVGDPCSECTLPAAKHRLRSNSVTRKHDKWVFAGVDGEGQGRRVHNYVLLAASTEDGKRSWYVSNPNGLNTVQALRFLTELPKHVRTFAFSFNYDLTKILTDLDDRSLYRLFRPELRVSKSKPEEGPRSVEWQGFRLNLQGSKFSVWYDGRGRVVWDVYRFFQAKFVNALEEWKVGSKPMLSKMKLMKAKRAEFDKETFDDVLAYCLEECRYMAELARKLIDAHFAAGLKLKSFYGAGSSASAMLDIMKIRDKVKDPPEEMLDGVYRAFFGGRFEHSVIGPIEGPIYSYDISSAYPYQLYFLPCLIHGTWHHTTNRNDIDHARAAVIRYSLGKPRLRSWAPFPFRTSDGAIAFPTRSGGGWVWKEEYLEGEALCPTTLFHEAWILETTCDCRPFEKIPHYYRERLRIGKEGPGIALKLGMNSCYGKLAQSVGNAPFNSWVWAGMITSGTRAQILNTMRAHRVLSNLYMVATDGIQTKEHLSLGLPQDTGTFDTPKPLGGWEEKIIEKGVFYARPGIYFPLNPTEQEIKEIKARGLGKGVLLEAWPKVVESWNNHRDSEQASIADVSRFCGAKSCVSRRGKLGSYVYRRADALDGKLPSYGQWVTREIALSFHPMPKRESINDDNTLKLRKLGNVLSAPYSKAVSRKSKEGQVMGRAKLELSEQPDYDYADYE